MRSYEVKLPRGIDVDIFNLPEDFEEQIKESFKSSFTGRKHAHTELCVWTM